MLSPVSPVSGADVSYQGQNLKQDSEHPVQNPAPQPPQDMKDALTSVSTSVRAVSGQIQLSNNPTILAEVLGKLLNINRQEDETGEAYATRLISALQSLPPEQKAALENALGRILKGLSISVLVEALRNSAGPAAARLAILFELARSTSGNKGAAPTRSAYLQDALPRGAALQQLEIIAARTLPSGNANTAQADDAYQTARLFNALNKASDDSEPLASQARTVSSSAQTEQARSMPRPDQPSKQPTPASPASAQPKIATPLEEASPARLSQPGALGQDGPEQAATSAAPAAIPRANTESDQATSLFKASGNAAVKAEMPRSDQPLPMQREPEDQASPIMRSFLAATPEAMEKLLTSVILRNLPQQAIADAMAIMRGQPDNSEAAVPDEGSTKPSVPQANPDRAGSTDPLDEPAHTRPELMQASRSAHEANLKHAAMDHPALQSAAAAMILKEGTPLPYVNYPAEKDEPESDSPPRGRWPSSSEEEGEQQQEQHQKHRERAAANDEDDQHQTAEDADADGASGDAEFYYLKMSSFV